MENQEVNIDEYYYVSFLKNELDNRIKRNSKYSLRSFANYLEMDAGALSKILNQKKIPSVRIMKNISQKLNLKIASERNIFKSLAIAYDKYPQTKTRKDVKALIKNVACSIDETELQEEIFNVISNWYYYALLQLLETEDFVSDIEWMSQKLNLNPNIVKIALSNLKKLNLITEINGRYIRTAKRLSTGDVRVTGPALKKRMKQICLKSMKSIEDDPIQLRSHSAITMAIDPDKINLAKSLIDNFMNEISALLETKKKKVYELQVSLFPLH